MNKSKGLKIPTASEDVGPLKLSCAAGGVQNVIATLANNFQNIP